MEIKKKKKMMMMMMMMMLVTTVGALRVAGTLTEDVPCQLAPILVYVAQFMGRLMMPSPTLCGGRQISE
jgi:hypothetical protein